MNPYIEMWLKVIDGMNNDNTYKLAWGRAIVEICHFYNTDDESHLEIQFDEISEHFLKYFWNQSYFFKLYQGPAKSKPRIQQITEEMIVWYQMKSNSKLPVWFDIAKPILQKDGIWYRMMIKRISSAIKIDVCWRFTKVGNEDIPLYKLDKERRLIILTKVQVVTIRDYSFILSQLMNYRWAQLLEKFNSSPRIAMKVKGISNESIRRSSLSKFKQVLLAQFPDGRVTDIYSGDLLDCNDISIDHVIPWSFMYSDHIWNLVITSRSHNSKKSNTMVDEDFIRRLKERNKKLKNISPEHFKNEIVASIKLDLIEKFYFQFKL
jgi:hypothetical protein